VDASTVPFPPTKGRRRRCALCGLPELSDAPGHGRFLLVPDPDGRGPVCPERRGCLERRQQLPLLPDAVGAPAQGAHRK